LSFGAGTLLLVPPTTNRQGGHLRRIVFLVAAVTMGVVSYAGVQLGTFLYAEDQLQRADAICVLAGTRMERPLEAADLYLKGWAPRVILTEEVPDPGIAALEQRGMELPTNAQTARDVMIRLGVPATAIEILSEIHNSTAHEADTFRQVCVSRKWKRIIVVTSKFHTRRGGFAVRRALKGSGVEVLMRGSTYDRADPHHWWRTRSDVRWAASESQKLLAYALGLGM
jgi:uncharacterized SAM-binding protein YcdF (DUF218 family)